MKQQTMMEQHKTEISMTCFKIIHKASGKKKQNK